jgi:type I restriction enzyme R subunit
LKDYTRKTVKAEFATLDDFLKRWNESDRKQVILDELLEQGILIEALAESASNDLSPFDLICHVAFDQPALTRQERVNNVKKRDVFTKYGVQARAVLDALLDKYADQGLEDLTEIEILQLEPFTEIGTPIEIVKAFGGRKSYLDAVHDLSTEIYKTA